MTNDGCAYIRPIEFQCSSASRKFLNRKPLGLATRALNVSVLFSEPKIPQSRTFSALQAHWQVSVLFSEPKIPQWYLCGSGVDRRKRFQCSSASRKFLNRLQYRQELDSTLFQCSSASRKFLNGAQSATTHPHVACFSALQRAENSSNLLVLPLPLRPERFSALQRAENSSINVRKEHLSSEYVVSVLFSEPKIPQFNIDRNMSR